MPGTDKKYLHPGSSRNSHSITVDPDIEDATIGIYFTFSKLFVFFDGSPLEPMKLLYNTIFK
jgi:hypothetical protein